MNALGSGNNARDVLIAELDNEIKRIQGRLRELAALTDQSQAEVRRLQQRSVDITTQINRLEANFDTVPRADIKQVYTVALDTRTRLLTMQNQLEKVQQDRQQLTEFSDLLGRLRDKLIGVEVPAIVEEMRSSGMNWSEDMIIRIVESQESDRKRLAQQMHDGPAQSLTNFILQAEICRRLFDRNPDRAVEELENLKTAASTTFQRVRDFIFDLRPMMLDDLGLVPTLRRYTTALQEKGGIDIKFTTVGEERRRMEPHTEVTMFRSVQELISYARENSLASKLELALDVSSNPITAHVQFNGKTIEEVESQADPGRSKLFSLRSLQRKVELVGGMLEHENGTENDDNVILVSVPAEEFN